MKDEPNADLDQVLGHAAAGNSRLLSSLRRWREEMPDALLRAALLSGPTAEMVRALKIETNRISHGQLLAHVHFNCSQQLRDTALEPALRAERLRNGLRNKKLLQERNEIMARLQARDLDALVFKGADLAYSVYPDPCCRVVGDIDLLVEAKAAGSMVTALLAEGFTPNDPTLVQPLSNITRSLVWTHPEFMVSLDVQIHLNSHAPWPLIDQLYFVHAITRQNEAGGEIRCLCPEHALVQVCAHGVAQNYYPPVRWAVDAALILSAAGEAFDWDRVFAAIDNNHSAPIVSVALNYLRLILGVGISQEVLAEISPTPSRRTFRTAWSYRLDLPNGFLERTATFVNRFREDSPDESLGQALGRLPKHLRDSQNASTTMAAVGSLARKAILDGER